MEKIKADGKKWIKSNKYEFDIADITTGIAVVAVALTIAGYGLVGIIIFIINCIINLIIVIKEVKRINLLVLQVALLVFNIYFLM